MNRPPWRLRSSVIGLLVACLMANIANGAVQPFKPVFHQPNDFQINGRPCAELRPDVTKRCPLLGVSVVQNGAEVSHAAIEDRCRLHGFVCEEGHHLFVDGSCRKCPEGMELVEEARNVYCRALGDPSVVAYKHLVNPFDCIGSRLLQRSDAGRYWPCYNEERSPTQVVEQYMIGNDLNQEATMTACAASIGSSHLKTYVFQSGVEAVFDFPVIHSLVGAANAEVGYLQCSKADPEPYNMLSNFWIVVYVYYGCAALIIFVYYIYKRIRENQLNKGRASNSGVDSVDFEDDTNLMTTGSVSSTIAQDTTTQTGFKKDILGDIAYAAFICATLGWIIFQIIIILDVYGYNLYTICTDKVIHENCRRAVEEGEAPVWRTGYECAAGCIFSYNPTSPDHQDWPYYSSTSGDSIITVIYMIVWHITTLWLLLTKIFAKKISAFFKLRCPMSKAGIVMCTKPIDREILTKSEEMSFVRRVIKGVDSVVECLSGKPTFTRLCRVHKDENGIHYFDFQCLRFCWNNEEERFSPSTILIESTHKEIYEAGKIGLSSTAAKNRLLALGTNSLDVEVPSIMRAIATEFFDYFYIYQFCCISIWYEFVYWPLASVLVTIVLLAGIIKLITKRHSEKKVKKMTERHSEVYAMRDGVWKKIGSELLVPGDVVSLVADTIVPCDCVVVDGRCVMDESSLTGEPTPVPKIGVGETSNFYTLNDENMKYTLLEGSVIQSVSPGLSGYFQAMVTATGAFTSKGKLVRDLMFPAPLSFTFEQHTKLVYLLLMLWGFGAMIICILFMNKLFTSWYYGMFLFSQVISPLIPAILVAALSQGSIHLAKKMVYCINLQRVAVAGKLKVLCFDKTGTLTKPGIDFKGIQYINPSTKSFELLAEDSIFPYAVKALCGTCHELDLMKDGDTDRKVGNEVDMELFNASCFHIEDAGMQPLVVSGGIRLRVLRRFEFDRSTMTMSVIVRDENTHMKYVFTKGSFESVARIVSKDSIASNYNDIAREMAKEGVYTLGIGYRLYDEIADVMEVSRQDAEKDLTALGLLLFNNALKPDTAEVIQEIRTGNIKPTILTGDHALTAVCVARKCGITDAKRAFIADVSASSPDVVVWRDYDTDVEIPNIKKYLAELESGAAELVISGRAFDTLNDPVSLREEDSMNSLATALPDSRIRSLLKYTRIFARLKPHQKVQVVSLYMEHWITGMCGDGANDLGALRMAHCGIAVASGSTEATIVAPFSSPNTSLRAVIDVVLEGRCTLAKAVSLFKALIMFGEIKVIVSLFQFYLGIVAPEVYWILWDSLINVGILFCLLQSQAAKVLTPTRPTAKLLGFETSFSILSQILSNVFWVAIVISFLFGREWYACKEFDANNIDQSKWYLRGDNYEAEVLALMATAQLLSTAITFNIGFDYRRGWWHNYWSWLLVLGGLAVFTYVFYSGPSFLSCVFRTNCGDQSLLAFWDELPDVKFSIPESISTAPIGCACSEQVVEDARCEAEYIHCENDRYNQLYHHNLIPLDERWVFLLLAGLNFACNIAWEAVVVVGPVRRLMRRHKALKSQLKGVLVEEE